VDLKKRYAFQEVSKVKFLEREALGRKSDRRAEAKKHVLRVII
jgi:hypothetical protein